MVKRSDEITSQNYGYPGNGAPHVSSTTACGPNIFNWMNVNVVRDYRAATLRWLVQLRAREYNKEKLDAYKELHYIRTRVAT